MRPPLLYRDARAWWYCPEIRSQIAFTMLCRILRLLVLLILAVPFAVLVVTTFLGDTLSKFSPVVASFIFAPARALKDMKDASIRRAHEIMPRDEIRKRIHGEESTTSISPKTDDASSDTTTKD